ncbi:MAG: regulatory iron-sulfur-containing complex subunit RicT [Caldisericia bacterium]
MEHSNKENNVATKDNDTVNDIIAVRFKGNQQYYHFKTGGINVQNGQAVIASTEKGVDLGYVCFTSTKPIEDIPLKTILRKANDQDLKAIKENIDLEIKARKLAQDEAKKLKLKMTFQVCKYSLDRKRATLYFTSEKRIDFRELVKNLASVLHLRVELWQIGTRDETRLFGGIGPCNRELCCSMFYSSRESVTVKDAKAQGLDINPQKITGMCGKLMCCLKFEVNEYKDKFEKLPSEGELVKVDGKEGKTVKVNPFGEMISVSFEEGNIQTFHASEVKRNINGEWITCEFEINITNQKNREFFSVSDSDENNITVFPEENEEKSKEKSIDLRQLVKSQPKQKDFELKPDKKSDEKGFSEPEAFHSSKNQQAPKKHKPFNDNKPRNTQPQQPKDKQDSDQNRNDNKKKFGKKPFTKRNNNPNQNRSTDSRGGSSDNPNRPGDQKNQKNKSKKVSNINQYLSNREKNKKIKKSNQSAPEK